jgi:REP element-mobilizing transposase RayT
MKKEFESMNCEVDIINGVEDHVHCLFSLNRVNSIAEVIKQVKGGSAHYINSNAVCKTFFRWQVGYAAFSVSYKNFQTLYRYIQNQKQHHKRNSTIQDWEIPV